MFGEEKGSGNVDQKWVWTSRLVSLSAVLNRKLPTPLFVSLKKSRTSGEGRKRKRGRDFNAQVRPSAALCCGGAYFSRNVA